MAVGRRTECRCLHGDDLFKWLETRRARVAHVGGPGNSAEQSREDKNHLELAHGLSREF